MSPTFYKVSCPNSLWQLLPCGQIFAQYPVQLCSGSLMLLDKDKKVKMIILSGHSLRLHTNYE